MTDDIAMLNKRDDLPEEVRRELCKVPARESMCMQIVELLRGYELLNVDEIIVGLWRKFQKITTKKTVYNRLQEMCDSGEIERVKPGYYKVTEAA